MSIDITNLRSELRIHAGLEDDDSELSDVEADLLLNRAYWELLDKFPFREKEVSVTFNTVAGTRLYDVPSPFEALRSLSIEDINSLAHSVLKKTNIHEYESKYTNSADQEGKPEFYVREASSIRLLPTPDDIYTLTLKYWTVLADLSNDNPDSCLPQSWDEVILYGALWRLYIRLGDFTRGNQTKAHWVNLVNSLVPTESKEERDTRFDAVSAPRNEYDV